MRKLAAPALLFVVVLAGYLANGRTIGSGDTLPARFLPWSVMQHGSLTLDPFPWLYDDAALRTYPLLDGAPYYLLRRNDRFASAYTPGPGLLALPVYAVPILLGARPDGDAAGRLEKWSAAIITALSAVVLLAALRRVAGARWAFVVALVYAFGTSSLSISGQGLWQHGPSQLFVALMVYCVVRGLAEERFLAYAGFAMSAAVAMRSTDLVLVAPVAAWIAWTRPRLIPRLALWAAPPALAMIAYNAALLWPRGGLGGHTSVPLWALFAQVPIWEGLTGILVSPSRGLFVYSPVLLFSLVGLAWVWRRGPAMFRALSLGLPLVLIVVGKWFLWWGGHTWGPRLLADALPVLCFFLYPIGGWLASRPIAKVVFVATAVFSIGAHTLGAVAYDGRWDAARDLEDDDARLWSWRGSPLAFYGREVLARLARGSGSAEARPTSADAPDQLAATYRPAPIPSAVAAGEAMPFAIDVTNTGGAVWLAVAPDDRGSTRLGWKWLCCGGEAPGGRLYLTSDLAPGRAAHLAGRIAAPTTPGEYTFVADMVSERVTWFSERGSPVVKATVTVKPLDIARLVADPIVAGEAGPRAGIATGRATYRAGEPIDITVALRDRHRPKNYDAYLALEGPGGVAYLFDGQRLRPASEMPWRPWVRTLPMPARATGRFIVPMPKDLPQGRYRWHVVLTEPGTYRAAARSSADFSIGSSAARLLR